MTALSAALLLNGCATSTGISQQTSQQKSFVYVSDYTNKTVQVFENNGNYIKQINHSFSAPMSVATDTKGNLYVKEDGSTGSTCAVDKFDNAGNFQLQIGECGVALGGTGPGIFDNVGRVTTDTAGNIWVSSGDFYYRASNSFSESAASSSIPNDLTSSERHERGPIKGKAFARKPPLLSRGN